MTAVEYIQHWEGFRPRLYLCPAGYPTIGYGTRVATWGVGNSASALRALIEADTGDWITREQATALMLPRVREAAIDCIEVFGDMDGLFWIGNVITGDPPMELLQKPRQIVMMDLFYNNGRGFVCKFPRFVEAVKACQWEIAHGELLWVTVPAPGNPGVKTRYYSQTGRRAECNAKIILTGEMPEVLP